MKITCKICGKEFVVKLSRAGTARCCSRRCQYNWLKQIMLGHSVSEETREKLSKSRLGIKFTLEHRAKLSLAHKGKIPVNKGTSGIMPSGPRHRMWKGTEVGYSALHDWVERKLGKPTVCEKCGKSGLSGQKIHWANRSGSYKRSVKDWLRLCVSCHKKYDLQR